jgi:hypothetical protein
MKMKTFLTVLIVLALLFAGAMYYFFTRTRNELDTARNAATDLSFQVNALEVKRTALARELTKSWPPT